MPTLSNRTTGLTRYQLFDVAEGLDYLHSREVVHGNLKGVRNILLGLCFVALVTFCKSNILVDATGCARITEVGLGTIKHNRVATQNGFPNNCGDVRWVAPEILASGDRGVRSKESDIFSFAMVITEVREK